MNNEIKEILDIYVLGDRELTIDYIDKSGIKKEYEDISNEALIDYITNLQEESSHYQEILDYEEDYNRHLYTELTNLQEENEHLRTQVNTCKNVKDKAIEYIENTDDFDIEIFNESTGGCLGTDLSKGAKNLLKILQGEDK